MESFARIVLGKNGQKDIVATFAGYGASFLVAFITVQAPGINGDTTLTQLAGYGVSALLAVLGRVSNS